MPKNHTQLILSEDHEPNNDSNNSQELEEDEIFLLSSKEIHQKKEQLSCFLRAVELL